MAVLDKLFQRYFQRLREVPSKDVFCLLDYLLALGGTYHRPKRVWPTILWYLLQLLTVYQFCMQALITFDSVARLEDRSSTIWSVMCLLTMTLCYVKQFLIWRYRGTIRIAILLIGMRTELEILMQYYGCLTKSWQMELSLGPFLFYDRYSKSPRVRALFWDQLRLRTRVAVQQHVQLLNFMVTLQPIYEKLFFIIYYQSLVVAGAVSYVIIRERFDLCSVAIILCTSISILECYWWCHLVDTFKELSLIVVGAVLYLILKEEFSLCSVAIVLCVIIFILECYWWCYQIDTFESINESISESLLVQCSQLPYSGDCHSEYVQTRTSLMIIASCSRSSVSFSCFGMCQISMVVFASLMNTCYSVLMFLVNICG
ncbi:hypothetical protein pipiens_018598 [Culex pipiens pipiens]|uniref:Odorant receptor n=1 Tax=Culex pipiens pipiens TaxID=38569 RepID=A0ABD1CB20_CULPP